MSFIMKSALACAVLLAVVSAVPASAAAPSASTTTIRNDAYGFEITVPKSWTARKIAQPDPDEAMKKQEFSFSVTTEPGAPEPKDWNGIEFNNEGGSADEPPPVVAVFAHKKPGQTPEQFAQLFESTVKLWGGKILESNKTATSLDYTYDLFAKCRFTVRYDNGTRYVIMYMVPSTDLKDFEKHRATVDRVVSSLRTR